MNKRQNQTPVDYWDSLADGMVALFLCILLIVLLFVLYFVQYYQVGIRADDSPSVNVANYHETGEGGVSEEEHQFDDPEPGGQNAQSQQVVVVGGGGGGADDGDDENETERHNRQEPAQSGQDHDEDWEKSAVLVQVVDGETLLPLARSEIEFELYDDRGRLLTLSDYYPARVEHTSFLTTHEGQFYLPEKIYEGSYLLRDMTDVEGYERAEDTGFSIDRYYDWEEPCLVTVKMYPLRTVIRIRLVDGQSGQEVGGGSFQVVAAENISTLDGTVRYHAGEVVDTILVNAAGVGESKELYFGKYLLRQEMVPEYYGIIQEDTPVELRVKSATEETLTAEKTALILNLRDALYDDVSIPDAQFVVTDEDGMESSVITDAQGQILLTDLAKNTTYQIRQTAATSSYRMDTGTHSFTVDGSGLIQGEVRHELTIENRMIRTSFRISGTILGNQVSDVRMMLSDLHGRALEQWTTTGQDAMITGLEPGTYLLTIGSDLDDPIEIYVSDESSIQEFHFSIWTFTDTGITLALIVLLAGTLLIVLAVARRRRQNRRGASNT